MKRGNDSARLWEQVSEHLQVERTRPRVAAQKMMVDEGAAMSRRYAVLIAGSLALTACLLLTGEANTKTKDPRWMSKDWTQWNSDDCLIILGKSPFVIGGSPWVAQGMLDIQSYAPAYLTVTLQLRSALPIRQALLRQIQIEKHYDRMSPQQKLAFDQRYAGDLTEKLDRDVVVDIAFGSENDAPAVNGYMDSKAEVPRQVALKLPNGSLVLPTQTIVLKNKEFENECQYIFPRNVDGKPLITAVDQYLVVVMGAPLVIDRKTRLVTQQPFQTLATAAQFPIPSLMYKGKLEY